MALGGARRHRFLPETFAYQRSQLRVELDTNSDGIINREELLEIGRQFYRSDDRGSAGNMLFRPYGV